MKVPSFALKPPRGNNVNHNNQQPGSRTEAAAAHFGRELARLILADADPSVLRCIAHQVPAPVSAGQAVQVARTGVPHITDEKAVEKGGAWVKDFFYEAPRHVAELGFAAPVSPPDGAMPDMTAFYMNQAEQLRGELSKCRNELEGKIEAEGGVGRKGRTTVETQIMANCMDVQRQELIDAGVIDAKVPPMFVAKAVIKRLAAQPAEGSAQVASDLMQLVGQAQKIAPSLATATYELTGTQIAWIVSKYIATRGVAPERSDTPAGLHPVATVNDRYSRDGYNDEISALLPVGTQLFACIDCDKQGAQGDA